MKIIFVPALPLNPPPGNLGQIWEVKVRNCRQPQNCRLGGGGGGRCENDGCTSLHNVDAGNDEVEEEEDRPAFEKC